MDELRPFQRKFVKAALAPGIDIAALSLPRGNGKSWLAGYLMARCLTPGDELHQPGKEYLLLAATMDQARIVFRFVRGRLGEGPDYRWTDSTQRIGAVHLPTNTRLRVISSDGKGAFGIVDTPLICADEPGAWSANSIMADALETALGKPQSPLKIIYIGTVAPAKNGWWHEMIDDGSHGSIYVQALQGDRNKWGQPSEIRRVNPLMWTFPESRKKLLEQRDAARRDPRLKARYLSYRLNVPTPDESEMLLSVEDWERSLERATPERMGQPICAVDLGAGRAFSSAVCGYRGGRVEALAIAPGIPSIEDQEKRDRVPAGTYQKLVASGHLRIANGLRVPPPTLLWEAITTAWGIPVNLICDRARFDELQDAVRGACSIEPRVTRWFQASFDIRATRQLFQDGPMVVAEDSRALVKASIAVATVKNDDQGNTRIVKGSTHNTCRDDVAVALALLAGAYQRANQRATT